MVKRLPLNIFYGLLLYMPLHILLSTWLGTSFHVLDFAKIAKDIVLIIGFLMALAMSVQQPWFKQLLRDKLVWFILGFIALNAVLALFRPTDQDAEILGLVYNTRFLIFFLYAALLTKLYDDLNLKRYALRIIMAVGVLVLFFGIVQYALLPNDALTHVGYQRTYGVLPAFFIDGKPDLERVMSTLRDPNSLGSYIIIVGSLALAFYLRAKNVELRKMVAWVFALSSLCLWFTFSRSAWLGFVLAACLVILFGLEGWRIKKPSKRYIVARLTVAIVLLAGGLFFARSSYFVQNVVFHADASTTLEDPNELRVRFWEESVDDIIKQPLGHGPGTAGLASIRNNKQGVVLNENYYLQMAYELGLVGFGLFLVILWTVGVRLYGLADSDITALGLFASFIGLALTNFLVHIWANEAVAYTWWGLAGLTVFGTIRLRTKSE